MTPSERVACWVLAGERLGLQDPAEFAATLRLPESETPTLRSIPSPGRVPAVDPDDVPEVRYDLAESSAGASYYSSLRWAAGSPPSENRYEGLTNRESEALCNGICALIDAAPQLGRKW